MINKMNPLLMTDFYKVGHVFQYPEGTTLVYSNLTPRKSRLKDVDKMVFFGLQYFIKEYLITQFNENFFNRPLEEVLEEYKTTIKNTIGDLPSYKHIEDLHKLGYLPIKIMALPEGTLVNMRVPAMTIVNTLPEFYWVTNFIESLLTASIWQSSTSATISKEYYRIISKYGKETGIHPDFIQWQGHDFSFRGMSSFESALLSSMGHLVGGFTGTDSICGIYGLVKYYKADINKGLIGGSVPASEHSTICAGSKEGEIETFKRLITKVYPNGIVSVVSDTWDLWKVCTEYVTELKDIILNRDGKLVIRPDSGDPADILCGLEQINLDDTLNAYIKEYDSKHPGETYFIPNKYSTFYDIIRNNKNLEDKEYLLTRNVYNDSNEITGKEFVKIKLGTNLQYNKIIHFYNPLTKEYGFVNPETNWTYQPTPSELGVVELLWNVFGGTITDKGYKLLDEHIGVIYGDSITLDRADNIFKRLKNKGFASQVVFGIGSYTYQYNTRDTFGFAVKSTYVEVNGESRNIFKDPITDDGTKKSAVGLLKVIKGSNGELILKDNLNKEEFEDDTDNELKLVFENSKLYNEQCLGDIRNIIKCN